MKLKIYWMVSGEPFKDYILTYEGDHVTLKHVEDILKQAKRRFKMPGKQYIILAGNETYSAKRINKDQWRIYQLLGAENEEH